MPEASRSDPAVEAIKVPPHSIEAEQSVLGGLMLDNRAWDRVADRVVESDFYRREHRSIFRAIYQLAENGEPFDVVTIHDWLTNQGLAEEVGGLPYLGDLANDTPSAANITAYADIIRERSVRRSLIQVGSEIAGSAFNPEGDAIEQLLDKAESRVFEIADQGAKGRDAFQPIKGLLTKAVDRIDELFQKGSAVTGIPTGFEQFDDMTSGLQPGDLVIVAGRPSMGKTSFAMNLAEHAAIKEGATVAVFSMEMPGDSLAMRMMSSLGRISQQKVRTGQLEDEDWPRITSAVQILSEAKMFIDDSPGLSPTELRARARRLKREHDLGMIVVDYLQLMQGSASSASENRATEISEISRGLKGLAKEMGVPVIALSQLNRSLEQRPNKRPVMSDLRESGAIEQDADLIVFIYRDEVYNDDSPDKGTAEIIIGKQRNGPIGTVRLTFLGQYTRFENFMPDVYGMGDEM
ncbi:MAG: replicative DNA helicase [Gammaproteobacteria bacterium]